MQCVGTWRPNSRWCRARWCRARYCDVRAMQRHACAPECVVRSCWSVRLARPLGITTVSSSRPPMGSRRPAAGLDRAPILLGPCQHTRPCVKPFRGRTQQISSRCESVTLSCPNSFPDPRAVDHCSSEHDLILSTTFPPPPDPLHPLTGLITTRRYQCRNFAPWHWLPQWVC